MLVPFLIARIPAKVANLNFEVGCLYMTAVTEAVVLKLIV